MMITLRLLLLITTTTTLLLSVVSCLRNNQRLNNELIETLKTMRHVRRSDQCFGVGVKCFNSAQCCQGFVCAAFDDYSGENPAVPGFCVKEKDLELCSSNTDCLDSKTSCLSIGRMGQRYCLTDSLMRNEINPIPPSSSHHVRYPSSGRLGSVCEDSADCLKTTDNLVPLCCKDVRRGKQGIKRMCDKVDTLSPCI